MKKALIILLAVVGVTSILFYTHNSKYIVYDFAKESSLYYALENDEMMEERKEEDFTIYDDFKLDAVKPKVVTSLTKFNTWDLRETSYENPTLPYGRYFPLINNNLTGEQVSYLRRDIELEDFERLINVPFEYTISPDGFVEDGEEVTVTFTYDEELAEENKIKFINPVNTYTIDLTYEDKYRAVKDEDITDEFVSSIPLDEIDEVYYFTEELVYDEWDDEEYYERVPTEVNTNIVELTNYIYSGSVLSLVYSVNDAYTWVKDYYLYNYDGYIITTLNPYYGAYNMWGKEAFPISPEEYIEELLDEYPETIILEPKQKLLEKAREYQTKKSEIQSARWQEINQESAQSN